MNSIKQILLFCVLASFFMGHAQKQVTAIDHDLKAGNRNMRAVFTVADETTGNYAVFLDDKKMLYGYLYSKEHEQLAKFASEGLPNKYKEIIGYSIEGKKIRLFLKDIKSKTFGSVLFDFDVQSSAETVYPFKLKKEFYVESHQYGNTFYLLTVNKNSSVLNFHIFKEGQAYEKKTMDFSKELFTDADGVRRNMSYLMGFGNLAAGGVKINKIDVTSPNSIEIANAPVKIYPKENGFTLTLEQNLATYHIDIDTDTFQYESSIFGKPGLRGAALKTNSYVFEGKLFQIAANRDNMAMTVTHLESEQAVKKITLNKEETIGFKNTPIIQEGGAYAKYREMEKTTKFLRKISQGDLGVSVYKLFDDYVITLGSTKEVATGGGFAPIGFGAFPVATAGAVTVTFNPTFYAYGGYSSTKAVRIECLFDNDLNHLEGEISLNVFDVIDDHAEKLPSVEVETVFKLDNQHIWGYYSKKANQYLLYQF